MADMEAELRKRFTAAIDAFVQPRILFGPKWIRPIPGQPGRFQFISTDKVANATGIPIEKIAKKSLANLKLRGTELEAKLTASGIITLSTGSKDHRPRGQRPSADEAKSEPAKSDGKKE